MPEMPRKIRAVTAVGDTSFTRSLLGCLSNNDGDVNENGIKLSNRFRLKNDNFARASRFFVHFFAVTARLPRENA